MTKKTINFEDILPPVRTCIRLNCMEPRATGKMVCLDHLETPTQKKAKNQAAIALESEAREFCCKVEELQREYGFVIAAEISEPFVASIVVKARGTNTKVAWLGVDE
jgi:hypothetical protein